MKRPSPKVLRRTRIKRLQKASKSIWFFPSLLTIVLFLLVVFQVNGSSIGVYHTMFYGTDTDASLLANQPRPIRSDEWLVSTQKAIEQKSNNFETFNKSVGQGEDTTVLADEPYRDWSIIFKPHNIGFLVLPFDHAFSLKWWSMAYFLVLSCYFFILIVLPKRYLLASLLSLAFFFSPFFQWWYLYGTLGPIYYALFGTVAFVKLLHAKRLLHAGLWSAAISYIGVSFALVLYPPFQIPCILIAAAFCLGYLFNRWHQLREKNLYRNLFLFAISLLIAAATVGLFFYQKMNVVSAIQDTAYPGHRVSTSGGYSKEHFLSGHLSGLLQVDSRAAAYQRPGLGITNQSEASGFILLFPALLPLILLFVYQKYKRRNELDYSLVALSIITVLFATWLFIPGLDIIGKMTLLDKVPIQRLIVGFGLLNILFVVLFIKIYDESKKLLSLRASILYSIGCLIFYLLLNLKLSQQFPLFIGHSYSLLLALPLPLITFCIMRKFYTGAMAIFLVFSFFSSALVNPLYRGTSTITDTPISQAIRQIGESSNKRWVSEDNILENFVSMNGYSSLSGTYLYPQHTIWQKVAQPNQEPMYNRYAHVNFRFDNNTNHIIKPQLASPSPDQLTVTIEPCDNFLASMNVGFILTSTKMSADSCLSDVATIVYPKVTFYIYELDSNNDK